MNIFAGKKALCFIALPYHNRILLPVMQELQRRGMEVVFFTASAEAAFEITLNDAGLPYRHALDYLTPELARQAAASFQTLRPVWQEKVLTHQLLQSVPIVIQDKVICSAVENVFAFRCMLEVEKPDLLFALHELNSWGKILGHLSHVYSIPYITFQEGLCYARVPLYRFHTDYTTACVVWGEADRQVLLGAGCSPDKTVALGNMDLWAVRDRVVKQQSLAATRKALNIRPDQKVVLFSMSYASYNTLEPDIFLDWLDAHPDVVVIFKWHPIQSKDLVDRAIEKFQGYASIRSVMDFDTYSLLALCDACVVVGNSTTGIEALFFDKPLIEIALPDHHYSYARQGVAESSVGFEDIGEKLDRIFRQGLTAEQQQCVEQFVARHFAFPDGQTYLRVADMAGDMLQARERVRNPRSALPTPGEMSMPCSLIVPVNDSSYDAVLPTLEALLAHAPSELFEVILVNAVSHPEARALLDEVNSDAVRVIPGDPSWSFAECCNRATAEAFGKYVLFLKPGLRPTVEWLEGLLAVAEEEPQVGVVGGEVLNEQGLIWQLGVAFDINQSPFPLYRLLPGEFYGARKQREFEAVEVPFLVTRELFCRLGGFSTDLTNRFEDVDFCLQVRKAGLRVLYTPTSVAALTSINWQPTLEQDRVNCSRFYARWTGSLWQNDEKYLKEDGLDREALSRLYREIAARLAADLQHAEQPSPS